MPINFTVSIDGSVVGTAVCKEYAMYQMLQQSYIRCSYHHVFTSDGPYLLGQLPLYETFVINFTEAVIDASGIQYNGNTSKLMS